MKKREMSLKKRRFIAKYMKYLVVGTYIMVFVLMAAVGACWFFTMEEVTKSGSTILKPAVTRVAIDAECAIVALPVAENSDVTSETVIAEVCTDAAWISRCKQMQRNAALLAALGSDEDLSASQSDLKKALTAELEAWASAKPPSTIQVKAGAVGTLVLGGVTEGSIVSSGDAIAEVQDFDLLQAEVTFSGKNVQLAQVGRKARILVKDKQGDEVVLRINTDSVPRVPFAGSRMDMFDGIAEDEVRSILEEAYVGRAVKDGDKRKSADFAFPVKTVGSIALQAKAEIDPASSSSADTPFIANFRTVGHPAVVIEGQHTASFDVKADEEELVEKVRAILEGKLKGKVVGEDDDVRGLGALSGLIVDVEVKGERQKLDWDPSEKPDGYGPREIPVLEDPYADVEGLETVKVSDRKYPALLQLVDPDPALKARVKELSARGEGLKVSAEMIVGERRIIMMLFRKR